MLLLDTGLSTAQLFSGQLSWSAQFIRSGLCDSPAPHTPASTLALRLTQLAGRENERKNEQVNELMKRSVRSSVVCPPSHNCGRVSLGSPVIHTLVPHVFYGESQWHSRVPKNIPLQLFRKSLCIQQFFILQTGGELVFVAERLCLWLCVWMFLYALNMRVCVCVCVCVYLCACARTHICVYVCACM